MITPSFLPLLLAGPAFATLSLRQSSCPVNASAMSLPPNQSQLVAPNSSATFTAVGAGVQNYSCSTTGTYVSIGAVAKFFDISCLENTGTPDPIQDCVFNLWSSTNTTQSDLVNLVQNEFGLNFLGDHYFINNTNGGSLVPVFDFRSVSGDQNDFVDTKKIGDISSPDGSGNVDWLELTKVSGNLATNVFRVFTVQGQPPQSCTPGSQPISVKYSAQYFGFGGS